MILEWVPDATTTLTPAEVEALYCIALPYPFGIAAQGYVRDGRTIILVWRTREKAAEFLAFFRDEFPAGVIVSRVGKALRGGPARVTLELDPYPVERN